MSGNRSAAFTALWRLLSEAQTVNQMNAVLIGLENRMTPCDEASIFRDIFGYSLSAPTVRHLITAVKLRLSPRRYARPKQGQDFGDSDKRFHLRRWGHSLWQHSRLAGMTDVPCQWSAWHRGGVSFYRYGSGCRRLIVAFAGGQSRFGMRTPTLLRFLEALESDVLMLRTPHRDKYSEGVKGVGATFVEVMEWVTDFCANGQYREVVVTGISKGALPAVITAGYVGADRAVVLGLPRVPSDLSQVSEATSEEVVIKSALDIAEENVPTVVVFSAGAPLDAAASAELFESMSRARLIEIPESPHAMLWPLAQRGELISSLKEWFDGPIVTAGEEHTPDE